MKTRTITDPCQLNPKQLLASIEQDPDAFTEGRRNNDMVNWFIAKRLVDLETDLDVTCTVVALSDRYEDDFEELHGRLSQAQRNALMLWSEDWGTKIWTLTKHYHKYGVQLLRNLWLPMDYAVPDPSENQTQLPMEG